MSSVVAIALVISMWMFSVWSSLGLRYSPAIFFQLASALAI